MHVSGEPPGGAYGFRVSGVPQARSLLVDAPGGWPALDLAVRITSEASPTADRVDAVSAAVRLRAGGWAELDRASSSVVFCMSERPSDEALVHPHLAAPAIVAAHWLGRESFHAGAFMLGGAAWVVLADKDSGKSSLLASLALTGVSVIADDVVILADRTVMAGPRSIDLRGEASRALGQGRSLGRVGLRERWRMSLDPVAPEVPLAGWITLSWGERVVVQPISGSRRLEALLAHRAIRLAPPEPKLMLELPSLPMFELSRPRRWDLADQATRTVLEALSNA